MSRFSEAQESPGRSTLLCGVPAGHRPFALAGAQALGASLAGAVQAEYDNWDEADIDTFAGGGICHFIAERLAAVLIQAGIEATTVSCMHEQHVYVVCRLASGVYKLDIPYSLYERGGGYSWTKIPGVRFEASDLDWLQLDADAAAFDRYVD